MAKDSDSSSDKSKKSVNKFLRFSSMGIQMGVTIGLGAWGGTKLDEYYQTEKPIWTIVLSLSAIAIAFYLVIKDINRMSKDED